MNKVTNCGPHSEITLHGRPWSFQTADVEVSSSGGRDSGHRLDEVRPLTYRVNDRHNGVVSSGLREFHDEIYTYDFPTFLWDWKWVELSDREAALGLGSKT